MLNVGRWAFSSALIPERIHPLPDDPIDQLRIGQTCFARRLREIFVLGQNRIWVGLNEIDFVVRRQPQVKASVAIDGEQAVDALTGFFDARDHRRLETDGELVLQAPAFAILLIPLRAISRNLRLIRRNLPKNQFTDRKDLQPQVTHQTDIKFAALDVFLRDHVGVVLLMNKRGAFPELLVCLNKRGLGNTVGGFFFYRLHQNRKLELFGTDNALTARNYHEIGNANAMIMQNFFRDAFVFAENESGRTATGEGDALHFKKGNDVLVEPAVILELVGQIKNYVGREVFQFLPHQIEVIKNGEMFRGVTKRAERAQDVCLSFPILRFHLL